MNDDIRYEVNECWEFNDSVNVNAMVGPLIVFEFYIPREQWGELEKQVNLWFQIED